MTTMLALSDGAGLILLGLGALFVVLAVAALVVRNRTKGTGPEIPTAMRPGPSDPVLENPQLTKLQGWGVLLVAFFVVWIPISLLAEPSRNLQQEKNLKTQAIERGSKSVQLFSEENQL